MRELGVIKRTKNKPYRTAKDPESTLVEIKKLLIKYNLNPDKIQTGIRYDKGQVYVFFEVLIPKEKGNVPMVLLFRPKIQLVRKRVNGKLVQTHDLASGTRQLFHKLYNKMNDVASGASTEVEELLPYIVLAGTQGQTILDMVSSTVESGRLSLASMSEALALPAPKDQVSANTGIIVGKGEVIDVEINGSVTMPKELTAFENDLIALAKSKGRSGLD